MLTETGASEEYHDNGQPRGAQHKRKEHPQTAEREAGNPHWIAMAE
jgi:hypothetical protein